VDVEAPDAEASKLSASSKNSSYSYEEEVDDDEEENKVQIEQPKGIRIPAPSSDPFALEEYDEFQQKKERKYKRK
jgi:hypothetical protein